MNLRAPPEEGGRSLRRVLQGVATAVQFVVGPAEPGTARQDVVRRAVTTTAIMAIMPIEQLRIAGWPAIVGACSIVLIYDIPLAYLVFAKQRFFLERVLGLVLDALVLMGASFYVFREMGAAGSASDIWLVFMVYMVTGGFILAPIGSLIYTALWTGWFAFGTLLYFEPGSQYREEMYTRLVFLGLIGLISLAAARELQKRRARLEQQNRQTMGMLATLVEARDTDAGAHLHHIQHFSRALARYLGLSDREAQEVAYASMIHDVGKANVPDAILKKAGGLDPDERHTMQQHTIWGDVLLSENQDFELARQVARWHHEHWDGSGYPDGLAAEEIPLAARIVAVADVYDALISERSYKSAWMPVKAIAELQRIAGSHLDPVIVDAFVELYEQGVIGRISETIARTEQPGQGLVRHAA
ncbi:MAG: HD-GYP domain-containing protein [Chloroflexi bacterium]|nr:HD-GYP domain-containing protein [Chloroflexota bacterium]